MAETPTPSRGARGATGKTGARGRAGKDAAAPDEYLKKADALQRSLDGVRLEMARQTDEIEAANNTANEANKSAKRSKRASRTALVGAALALVGVVLGGFAIVAIINARTEARHTTCLRNNAIRYDAGEAAAKKAQDFIVAQKAYTHAKPSTGALLEAEKAYVVSQRQVTLDAYPRYDCTKAGIDASYKNPPPPPPEPPCVPDGKGLCKSDTKIDGAATQTKPTATTTPAK